MDHELVISLVPLEGVVQKVLPRGVRLMLRVETPGG